MTNKVKRYGIPYKGSKNKIAEWVVDNIPTGGVFVETYSSNKHLLRKKERLFVHERQLDDYNRRMDKLF